MLIEKNIIDSFKKLTFRNKKSLNLSDDVYYDKEKKIVFSTDIYEENIHFLNSNNPKQFVKKLFRSSISDIIAKGSIPKTYFMSISFKKLKKKWLESFNNELLSESKKFDLFLGGGDTIRSNKLTITLSIIGNVTSKPILRETAKLKDDIYVTGNLGNSYIGLQVNLKKLNLGKDNYYFKNCYSTPDLPFKFSKYLNKFASSSMDISDGLVKDLKSLCYASKCGAFLDFLSIPFSKRAIKAFNNKKINPIDIFSKGDDYQILFTAPKKHRKIIKTIAKKTYTKVTHIGEIRPKNRLKMSVNKKIFDLTSTNIGYIHTF